MGDRHRLWIDLANAPQVLFFVPIVDALRGAGVDPTMTARDFTQTAELARRHFPEVHLVGTWGRRPAAKASAIASRAARLARFARGREFHLAVSHNSYAQILAAKALRLAVVTTMDYEHQPANHLAFRLADIVLVPEAFPRDALRRFGARRVRRYPGLKEEVYLRGMAPTERVRQLLEVGDRTLVVLRPPPDFATYHRFDNPLFEAAVERVLRVPRTVGLVLPRTPRQAAWARLRADDRLLVADRVFDGPSLLDAADLFVGAGGTMNREAALLGVPTFSLFAGRPGAADLSLVERGLMTIVRTTEDVERIDVSQRRRTALPRSGETSNRALDSIVGTILESLPRSRV